MRAVIVLLSCFLTGFSLQTQAGAFEPGPAPDAGLDPARLARIDAMLEKAVQTGEIPGAVALVARKGVIGYHKSFGYADLEKKTPMRNDSLFRIASMTKAVTSVAAMVLYEQGHFRLHDPVSKFIPEFKNPQVLVDIQEDGHPKTVPAKREISILDLLTHTSGIAYPFGGHKLRDAYKKAGIIDGFTAEPRVLADVMKELARMPLLHHPGERWTYGLNTDVLGYLVEVVSGKTLDKFFRDEIFEPLRMNDTFFYLPQTHTQRLVTLYKHVAERKLVPETFIEEFHADPLYPIKGARSYFSGGAGLSATAMDYARFTQMLLNHGTLDGRKVLSRKSVELMQAGHFDEYGGQAADFGLGFNVLQDLGAFGELGTEGTYSWGGAYYTSYWIDPREELVAVFLCQIRPARTDVSERFRILVYQAVE